MNFILNFVYSNITLIVLILVIVNFIILIICISLNVSHRKLKKKYNYFMGSVNAEDISVEKLLDYYINEVRDISTEHNQVLNNFKKLEHDMHNCIQKVGIVKYNPFDDMGGNLCFAIALLDKHNNGVVLNGIHSRSNSYTYAKQIENGESDIVLSAEEIQAIDIAMKKSAI